MKTALKKEAVRAKRDCRFEMDEECAKRARDCEHRLEEIHARATRLGPVLEGILNIRCERPGTHDWRVEN